MKRKGTFTCYWTKIHSQIFKQFEKYFFPILHNKVDK